MAGSDLQKWRESFLHFFIGGASGATATLLIQPIDTLKVQVQVVSEQLGKTRHKKPTFVLDVVRSIYREKGLAILYRGLGSAIWRQIFYASARLGSYTWAIEKLRAQGTTIGTK